jgi:hypothetical protein
MQKRFFSSFRLEMGLRSGFCPSMAKRALPSSLQNDVLVIAMEKGSC